MTRGSLILVGTATLVLLALVGCDIGNTSPTATPSSAALDTPTVVPSSPTAAPTPTSPATGVVPSPTTRATPAGAPSPTPTATSQAVGVAMRTPTPTITPDVESAFSPTPTQTPSPTPTPTATPTAVPTPTVATLVSPTATASTEEGVTSARIVGYSPDSVVDVDLGQTVALTATILNTGTLTQRFDVVVTISRPDGRTLETLRTSLAAALDPESQRTVAWEYVVSEPGDFLVGFVVKGGGTAAQDIVLDRAPPEPQRLIFGRPSPTPTATIAPVVPGPQPSPTPTQVVVVIPPAIPTPTPAPTATPVAPGIDAEVVGFSPANLVNVDVGETVGLSATIANRGSVGRQFLVGATVTNSGGDLIADYTTTLGVTLESNEQAVVAWDHPVTGPGNFAVQFSVWENEPGTDQNLLDREPSTAQTLITATVAAVSTPTALPTPTVVPTPSATRTPSPTATMVPAPPVVLADVTSHSPSTAQLIQQGQTVGLSMEVQNKGSSQWNFEVRARIERLDGTFVAEYVDVSGVVLPGQSTTFAWSHTATNVGDLYLRFEASRSGSFSGDDLLDSVPDAPGVLIRVLSF